jgi:signal transduction histidine kinase
MTTMPETINVLLAEDNPDDADLVRLALAKAKGRFEIICAERLSEALERVQAHSFDVALLDRTLPDSRGLATIRRLKRARPNLPIILLTANDSDKAAFETLEEGAQDYLVKDHLLDAARTEILERSIHYAIHRQKSSETQRLLRQIEASHELLKSKNRRLAKLCNTAERFVENASHEFRTPLTVIKEYTSLLHEGMLGSVNERQSEFLSVVENRADDLNRMVDDMLDVSKLDAGLMVMSRRECTVASIIAEIWQVLETKAASRAVSITAEVAPGLPTVYCDPEKIGRVLINLGVNAIKFCAEAGRVHVSAQHDPAGRQILVSISDNGRGIQPEDLTKIFARFKQVGHANRDRVPGFGLGLSIAKDLVDVSFGELTVESELHQGSTFSFTLPVADPLEVVRRYCERLARQSNGTFKASLVSATPPPNSDARSLRDCESFLNYIARAEDLMFRRDDSLWILVMATGPSGVRRFLARATEEMAAVSRNRPQGPLPEITFARKGSWRASLQNQDKLLTRFASLMQSTETVVDCSSAGS